MPRAPISNPSELCNVLKELMQLCKRFNQDMASYLHADVTEETKRKHACPTQTSAVVHILYKRKNKPQNFHFSFT